MIIKRSIRKTISIRVKEGNVIVRAPIFMFKKNILNFVEKHKQWINKQVNEHKNKKIVSKTEVTKMKKQAKKYILDRVIKIASDYGFEYNKIRITSAKTRWGSCSSKKNLNFSFYLIGAPKKVIDYVIVHELAHLSEMNHSKKFWRVVEIIMPKYKKHKKWLKDNGNSLIF